MKGFVFLILVLTIAVQLSEQQPRRRHRKPTRGRRPLNSVARSPNEPQSYRPIYHLGEPLVHRGPHYAVPPALFVVADREDGLDRRNRRGKGKRGKNTRHRARPSITPESGVAFIPIEAISDQRPMMDTLDTQMETENTIRV